MASEQDLRGIVERLRAFTEARDWRPFHRPKDLAASISIEAAELLEHFQWTDPSAEEVAADAAKRREVEAELADIVTYCLLFYERLGSDPAEAIAAKMAENERKYPVEKARGRSEKYNRL